MERFNAPLLSVYSLILEPEPVYHIHSIHTLRCHSHQEENSF